MILVKKYPVKIYYVSQYFHSYYEPTIFGKNFKICLYEEFACESPIYGSNRTVQLFTKDNY